MTKLSENFNDYEFKCRCCGQLHPDGDKPPMSLILILENIRAHFGAPVVINSGYRCYNHNTNVGGARNSRHLHGDAADITVSGVDAYEVYSYADDLVGSGGGVGSYNNFTHVDVRGYKARW